MIRACVQYLVSGSDEQYMHPEWLETKCAEHEVWTRAQADPRLAIIVSNSAAMARRDFWQRIAEKQVRLVARFPQRIA